MELPVDWLLNEAKTHSLDWIPGMAIENYPSDTLIDSVLKYIANLHTVHFKLTG